jgi:hypothetical protein
MQIINYPLWIGSPRNKEPAHVEITVAVATEAMQPPSGAARGERQRSKVVVGSCSATEVRTLVTARTSTNHLDAPLAAPTICARFPPDIRNTESKVVAAHGDSHFFLERITRLTPEKMTLTNLTSKLDFFPMYSPLHFCYLFGTVVTSGA